LGADLGVTRMTAVSPVLFRTGGSTATGGVAPGTGGRATGTGGVIGTGGRSVPGTGGIVSTGGSTGAGARGTGGVLGTGGVIAPGGRTGTTTGAAGARATGGTTGAAGRFGTGAGGVAAGGASGGSAGRTGAAGARATGGAGGSANCVDSIRQMGYAYSPAPPCSMCKDNTTSLATKCEAMIDCIAKSYPCTGNCEINCLNMSGGSGVLSTCVNALVTAACP